MKTEHKREVPHEGMWGNGSPYRPTGAEQIAQERTVCVLQIPPIPCLVSADHQWHLRISKEEIYTTE